VWNKIWHDPVWSKVISALIVAGLGLLVTYFKWWPPIWGGIVAAINFILSDIQIPIWLFAILLVIALGALILALFIFIMSMRTETAPHHRYTQDDFVEMRWRWNYGDAGYIYDVVPFCPNCDMQVYGRPVNTYGVMDRIRFECDSCHTYLGEHDKSWLELEDWIKRLIQKNIRTGNMNQSSLS
jgi:hypothetical protein